MKFWDRILKKIKDINKTQQTEKIKQEELVSKQEESIENEDNRNIEIIKEEQIKFQELSLQQAQKIQEKLKIREEQKFMNGVLYYEERKQEEQRKLIELRKAKEFIIQEKNWKQEDLRAKEELKEQEVKRKLEEEKKEKIRLEELKIVEEQKKLIELEIIKEKMKREQINRKKELKRYNDLRVKEEKKEKQRQVNNRIEEMKKFEDDKYLQRYHLTYEYTMYEKNLFIGEYEDLYKKSNVRYELERAPINYYEKIFQNYFYKHEENIYNDQAGYELILNDQYELEKALLEFDFDYEEEEEEEEEEEWLDYESYYSYFYDEDDTNCYKEFRMFTRDYLDQNIYVDSENLLETYEDLMFPTKMYWKMCREYQLDKCDYSLYDIVETKSFLGEIVECIKINDKILTKMDNKLFESIIEYICILEQRHWDAIDYKNEIDSELEERNRELIGYNSL